MKNKNTDTKRYERYELLGWKREVKKTQKCCYVSGEKTDLQVHHANISFSEIFNMAHDILNLEYHKNVEDYEPKDLDALTKKILELHEESVPVVLHKDVHLALHKKFGEHVDLNQINEFKQNFNNKGDDEQ